jgi:hypothetical protein
VNDATFVPRLGVGAVKIFCLLTITFCLQAIAGQNVLLSWDGGYDVASYNVYYGIESGNYTGQIATTENYAVITNLTEGETYYFAVTAVDSLGLESLPSEEVSYSVPAASPPTNAPVLSMQQSSAGDSSTTFSITASGALPSRWTLQASRDLLSWNAISSGTNAATNMTVVVAQNPQMFFRLKSDTPGVLLTTQTAQTNPFANSFFITATGATPVGWTVESSSDLINWKAVANGTNSPVNVAVIISDAPQMFFRLKGE